MSAFDHGRRRREDVFDASRVNRRQTEPRPRILNSAPFLNVSALMKTPLFHVLRAAALLLTTAAAAGDAKSVLDLPLKDIDGKATTLGAHAGKVLLVVNVASECGNTPQYAGLQALWEKYKDRGLVVCGFPCNDFGGQEPGSPAEIKAFCQNNYRVTFPMFQKVKVVGADRHPLYAALTGKDGAFPGDVTWNFGKFLIGRDGKPRQRFEPDIEPNDPLLVKSIEEALAAK
jgi:glutathione peroxidase